MRTKTIMIYINKTSIKAKEYSLSLSLSLFTLYHMNFFLSLLYLSSAA